jgi:hypothetical protein
MRSALPVPRKRLKSATFAFIAVCNPRNSATRLGIDTIFGQPPAERGGAKKNSVYACIRIAISTKTVVWGILRPTRLCLISAHRAIMKVIVFDRRVIDLASKGDRLVCSAHRPCNPLNRYS